MKVFALEEQSNKLLTPEITSLLLTIEEKKGRIYSIPKKKKLNRLHDLSKRRSITSSNKIEGIEVTKTREDQLFLLHMEPSSREDYELLGYNAALSYMMDNYEYLSLSESLIKDFHYRMYRDFQPAFGGQYKVNQNYINSYDSSGNFIETVFTPSAPEEVGNQMGNLIWQFNTAINKPTSNKLLLIFIFILDFLCIHPFPDGNGRVSRLLTSFLLLKYGYNMDEYYSLSYLILEHQSDYYKSLYLSDREWHENNNNPYSFVHYHLLRLIEGYQRIEYIIDLSMMKGNCKDKVYKVIKNKMVPVDKTYIEECLYEYSRTAIEKALAELLSSKQISKINERKNAKYVAN